MLNNIEEIFHYLHENPELSYKEYETTKYIISYLSKYPIKIHKLEPTGLIAVIDNNAKTSIAFRTDIDALPINEKNNFSYKSKFENVMHACGHDGHISMLLQFITNIFEKNLKFEKNLVFIFQPAEEVDGGAKIVLESKLLDKYNVEKIFGLHLWPELQSGVVGVKANELMGTNFVFDLKIFGKSAHASTPQNAVDSSQVLAEFIQNINFLIAKATGPMEPVVINIGKINGGVASNVIIDEITVVGTIRAGNDETLEKVVKNLKVFFNALELKYNCKIQLTQTEITYPAVINHEKIINDVITQLKLDDDVEFEIIKNPTLACEDFGFYCKQYETAFFFVGTQDEKHRNMLHSSNFSFDIEVLNIGVKMYEKLLNLYT